MDVGQKIKSLLHEAELYRKQGLLKESMALYTEASELIRKVGRIKNRESILKSIDNKRRAVEKEYESFQNTSVTPEMSKEIQDLIKEKFSFAANGVDNALEGAIALAKFGQYDRALGEFRELLHTAAVRVPAAKNIIRCHVAMETFDDGIEEFRDWLTEDLFSPDQLANLRVFFQNLLDKRGVERTLAGSEAAEASEADVEIEIDGLELQMDSDAVDESVEDELLDISSIGIYMANGPQKGQLVEFDISFQSGNEISLLVPSREKALIEHMTVGSRLDSIEFYSPFAMFKGSGVITSNTKISTGPKRGDYSLDIKVTST